MGITVTDAFWAWLEMPKTLCNMNTAKLPAQKMFVFGTPAKIG
jgi:hypothetical protein